MSAFDSTLYWLRKWDLWKKARQFPDLYRGCDYSITFVLGRDDFGFSVGNAQRRYSGPELDLSGATVKLICRKMPVKPSYPDAARGEEWTQSQEVFEVSGTVQGSDSGEVVFDLDSDATNVLGACLAQIEVTESSGRVVVPGMVRMNFLEKF